MVFGADVVQRWLVDVEVRGVAQYTAQLQNLGGAGTAAARAHFQSMRSAFLFAGFAFLIAGTTMQRAGQAITDTVKSIIKEYAEYEDTLVRTTSILNANAEETAALIEMNLELAKVTPFTIKEVATTQRILAQAGSDVNEILAATPQILDLATAGYVDIEAAANIAVKTMRAFQLESTSLVRITNTLTVTAITSATNVEALGQALKFSAPIAREMGIAIEELAGILGFLADIGLEAGIAGRGFSRVLTKMMIAEGFLADETIKTNL